MISIDAAHTAFEEFLAKEWLEVDGRGGYSSGTLVHCHTRKYHGLMVANLERPPGRYVLVSKFEDSIHDDTAEYHLSVHKYPMVYAPGESTGLVRFDHEYHPRFTYCFGNDIEVVQEILFLYGECTLLVRYALGRAPRSVRLTVKPLLAFRGIHELSMENRFLKTKTDITPKGFAVAPYDGMPRLFIETSVASRFHPHFCWYRNFEYLTERERGFPYHEDLFMPGILECELAPGSDVIFRLSLEGDRRPIVRLWEQELSRRKRSADAFSGRGTPDAPVRRFSRTAGDFVIRERKGGLAVIAGYHWFYRWGRDTVISIPGLMFATGRMDEGVEILRSLALMRKDGLLPNVLSEYGGEPSYNSVDASLWFIWAVQEYLRAGGDMRVVREYFWPVIADIVHHYYAGIPGTLRMRGDGLIEAGDRSTQFTWMDAKVSGSPVTPRHGCPVEINALWYNALRFAGRLRREYGGDMTFDPDAVAEKLKETFHPCFWIDKGGYLADVYVPDGRVQDESVRPNQIFAVSLPFPVIDDPRYASSIVKKVTDDLLTPRGLRSLSPADPRYRGECAGDPGARDGAYHQGTVWPWLLGHYGEALMKTATDRAAARTMLKGILSDMELHLNEAGLGHVSEIFDGDAPHAPRGCIAQAWSLAEVTRLRVLLERMP